MPFSLDRMSDFLDRADKVEAMYEPQQDASSSLSGGGKTYDSTALTEAASRALSAKAQGGDGVESGDSSQAQAGGAIEDVARAVRVAELLGLRLVGWCLSHDKVSRQLKVHP